MSLSMLGAHLLSGLGTFVAIHVTFDKILSTRAGVKGFTLDYVLQCNSINVMSNYLCSFSPVGLL